MAARGRTPEIIEVIKDNDIDRLKAIVELEPEQINKTDGNGRTALMWSIYYDDDEITDFLLDNGADVNIVDKYGDTALMYDVKDDKLGYIANDSFEKLLNNKKLDFNIQNNDGNTALMDCIKYNKDTPDSCLPLIKKTNVNIQNKEGNTFLMLSLDREIVNDNYFTNTIIDKYDVGDLNIQNKDGDTALILACKYGKKYSKTRVAYMIIVKQLLLKGADYNIKNKEGKTAMDVAPEVIKKVIKERKDFNEGISTMRKEARSRGVPEYLLKGQISQYLDEKDNFDWWGALAEEEEKQRKKRVRGRGRGSGSAFSGTYYGYGGNKKIKTSKKKTTNVKKSNKKTTRKTNKKIARKSNKKTTRKHKK